MTHKASGCHISVELIHEDPEHVNMIATASHHECIATSLLCRTAANITLHVTAHSWHDTPIHTYMSSALHESVQIMENLVSRTTSPA